MKLLKTIGFLLTLIAALGILAWINKIPDLISCTQNNIAEAGDCFTAFVLFSPPIKEATDLANTCNNSTGQCLIEVTKKAIEEKLS